MEYYLVTNKNEILINGTTWITFENAKEANHERPHIVRLYLQEKAKRAN